MVRNARAAEYEATPRPVIAVGNDYPAGHVHPPHSHGRAQLLYGAVGTMIVETAQGTWVVPPQQAVWIPALVRHGMRMVGPVTTRSVYLAPAATAALPTHCQVIGVAPLLRTLLLAAVDLPPDYPAGGRADKIMALLVEEIAAAPPLPLCLPMPASPRLAARCRAFMHDPTPHATIDGWCDALGTSRRAFTRRFRAETGMSFAAWVRRACVIRALPRLAAGEAVTTVALDLGYASPAAFSSMFREALGMPPSAVSG